MTIILGLTLAHFALPICFALAALQNVTIDDAVLTGSVAPTYLPSPSKWSLGNASSGCFVKPDPSMAYNGTWHETTFFSNSTVLPAFEFTFEGSGLYIFFVLANKVPNATTFTHVSFTLDGIPASSFLHNPSTSTNYLYNQAVYANDSMPYDRHTMVVKPNNDSANNVLMLFDYLIYTTDKSSDTAVVSYINASGGSAGSVAPLSTRVSLPPPTLCKTSSMSSRKGYVIIGGIVTGMVALILAVATIPCYQRYKRRKQFPSAELTTVHPFVSYPPIHPLPLLRTSLSIRMTEPSRIEPRSRSKTNVLPVTVPPSNHSFSVIPPSQARASFRSAAEILEQVGLLRDEIAHLRRIHGRGQSVAGYGSEAPPEYS